MQWLLGILLALVLCYLLGVAMVVAVSIVILRQKLRKYHESGRFGY